jgi:hypothetical protein
MTDYPDLIPNLLGFGAYLLPAFILTLWLTGGKKKSEPPTPADLDLDGPDWLQTMRDNSHDQPPRKRPFVIRRILPRFFK